MVFVATLFLILLFSTFWGLVFLARRALKKSAAGVQELNARSPGIAQTISTVVEKIVYRILSMVFFLAILAIAVTYFVKTN